MTARPSPLPPHAQTHNGPIDLQSATAMGAINCSGGARRPVPSALSWTAAQAHICDLSNGWFYLEAGCLFERELDALGCETQPRPHGLFRTPADAVAYVATLLRPRRS